jgi:hypothetical protein
MERDIVDGLHYAALGPEHGFEAAYIQQSIICGHVITV